MRIEFVEIDGMVEVYNCGVLILGEESYNEIVLTIKGALTIINDLYQIKVLKEILKQIGDMKGLVA